MLETNVRYCIKCGRRLSKIQRYGRQRPVCGNCGWVYFPDPKVAVAAVVRKEDQILLVQRVNEPFQGQWSVPAGFMDAGEDPVAAVQRECLEETGLVIRVEKLLDIITGREHKFGADILLIYIADVISGQICAGDDAEQAAFFPMDELPPLAFESTRKLLARLAIESAKLHH